MEVVGDKVDIGSDANDGEGKEGEGEGKEGEGEEEGKEGGEAPVVHKSTARPVIANMTTLKVDNLSYSINDTILREMFGRYGEVGDVYIPRNYANKQSKGFAFVRFIEKSDAEDAVKGLEGTVVDGRALSVHVALLGRPQNPPRMFNNDQQQQM
ncbi:hypothetical protein B484DRAFT_333198 [Ochromonadaceae sp. CCMP2298]|nr:hypothetical protein B484DRAFT_333198 [Ochromonadaceae sp. CCMP2298]